MHFTLKSRLKTLTGDAFWNFTAVLCATTLSVATSKFNSF